MSTLTAKTVTGTKTSRSALLAGATVAAVAAVLNVVIWAVATVGGVDFAVTQNGDTTDVNAALVVLMTVLPIALGTLALWTTRKRAGAWAAWAWVGLELGVLTVFMPFTVEAATSTSVALALMHVVTGAAWFAVLARAARRASEER